MFKMILFFVKALGLLMAVSLIAGCASLNNRVLVVTGTVLGIEIAENPATQLYHAKLGYARSELAMVPTDTTNRFTPDVITEVNYTGLFSRSGGIYQRLAVGSTAVAQPGAMAMFAKNSSGNIDTNAVELLRAVRTVPATSAPAQAGLVPLSAAFKSSTNKPAWDAAAIKLGYASFSALLLDPGVTKDVVDQAVLALRATNLIP